MKKLTQRERILEYLSTHPEGLNSYTATYDMKIKQAPTRVKELRQCGYEIKSMHNKDGSVNWILQAYPKQVMKTFEFKNGVAIIHEHLVQERV